MIKDVLQHPRLEVVRRALPRRRRWERLLESLDLDVASLARPVPPPGDRDVIICGAPRTGTSLASAVIHAPPRSVVVMEPWDGLRLPPAELFRSLREELSTTGSLTRGRLDTEALSSSGDVRWIRDGERTLDVRVDPDALVSVKWPGFWRYLPLLPETRFVVCLREPAEVIASFERAGGRLRDGLDYDVAFNRAMNDQLTRVTDDPITRRLEMFDYIHERIVPYLERKNVFVLRYERWFEDPVSLLRELSSFLGEDVTRTPVRLRPGGTAGGGEVSRARAASRTASAIGYPARVHA